MSKGWAEADRLREGRVLHKAERHRRDGKRKRGATGWWWPATRRSPGGTTSPTPRSRPSWPPRSEMKDLSVSSNLSRGTIQRWQEEEGSNWMVGAGYKVVTRRYDITDTQEQTRRRCWA